MIKFITGKWSFYISGVVIAFLFVLTLYILDTPVGMSDAYLMLSEYCRDFIYKRRIDELPMLDWQTGFLGGILIGAFIASIVGGEWKFKIFPEGGSSKGFVGFSVITPLQGIAGGFLVMLGLQLAGDSFLGQWAAAIQLSTGAWIFLLTALIFGGLTTFLLSLKSGEAGKGKKGGD